ncbi:tetratricopeptide repeat protein [Aestuariirhabdus litorea]|uniref:Sel1 repeat family protein n=1 Tax=Aestuariirhabdus litorea TaxID=2528527 RepID=A0A3P3VUG6_9GAMM|nr:tetratricopeptide repeat protein [Aestuariirhabdus litorea]RRJ85266.1 sel1 repeat family protein [Aestuariirhabdus litorea]RWW98488.1 sel1 repeat family protein [Endozoicomonadaceae bacterium GTF-13]
MKPSRVGGAALVLLLSSAACFAQPEPIPGTAAVEPDPTAEAIYLQAMEADRNGRMTESIGLFQRAAKMGHPGGQVGYAYLLHKGGYFEESFRWYERAAQQGDALAMLRLAMQYMSGEGVEKSFGRADEWLNKSAELGNFQAIGSLYEAYHNGSMGYDQDNEKALFWLNRAIEQGSSYYTRILAEAYRNGELGLDIDNQQALELYRRAASQGDLESIRYLIAVYTEGLLGQLPSQEEVERWESIKESL